MTTKRSLTAVLICVATMATAPVGAAHDYVPRGRHVSEIGAKHRWPYLSPRRGKAAIARVVAASGRTGDREGCYRTRVFVSRVPRRARLDCWIVWSAREDEDPTWLLDIITVWLDPHHRLHYNYEYGSGLVPLGCRLYVIDSRGTVHCRSRH